jgi:hypothetical protein
MGGGGNNSQSLGDTSELEKKAKDLLLEANRTRRNAFISFAYEDINEVTLLRGHAKNERSDIDFADWSVREPFDSDRSDYIRRKITERINQASVTVVYLSEDTAKSSWVKWEVEKSLELGKHVIATFAGDTAPSVPDFLKAHDIKSVPWKSLGEALKKF